jgi:hypothetical protein
VTRRVSGATPTVKEAGVVRSGVMKDVMVKQTPLLEMESPSCASERRVEVAGKEIVRVVPFSGSVSRAETTKHC